VRGWAWIAVILAGPAANFALALVLFAVVYMSAGGKVTTTVDDVLPGRPAAAIGLRRLADLVAAGQLAPHISVERPWTEIAQVAADLIARKYPGKAVLTLA